MKLTKPLLLLISLIQSYVKYNIDLGILEENSGDNKTDWYSKANEYYYSLDEKYFEAAGIKQNKWYLEQIIHYDISNEIDKTEYHELDKFTFPEESKYNETIVSSFFFYMWNAWCKEECEKAFGNEYDHFWQKWCGITSVNKSALGAAEQYYCYLSDNYREKLVKRACEVFEGSSRRKNT